MPASTWWIAGALSLMLTVAFVGREWRRNQVGATDLNRTLAEMRQALDLALQTNAVLAQELAGLQARAEELAEQMRDAESQRHSLEDELRQELASKEVTISELQGKLTVSILDRVLFDSGEAKIKTEGEAILAKLAKILGSATNRLIQISGHTDNVPIRGVTRGGFSSNWELSAGRAIAAVRFLHEKMGLNPTRLSAAGYGEFHPVADNQTPEGRAQNRRISVVVLPEELISPAQPSAPAKVLVLPDGKSPVGPELTSPPP